MSNQFLEIESDITSYQIDYKNLFGLFSIGFNRREEPILVVKLLIDPLIWFQYGLTNCERGPSLNE